MGAWRLTLSLLGAAPMLFFGGAVLAHDSMTYYCVIESTPGGRPKGCYSGLEMALGVERPARLNDKEGIVGAVVAGLGVLSLASGLAVGVVGLGARRRRTT
jgi:hypothetical protein